VALVAIKEAAAAEAVEEAAEETTRIESGEERELRNAPEHGHNESKWRAMRPQEQVETESACWEEQNAVREGNRFEALKEVPKEKLKAVLNEKASVENATFVIGASDEDLEDLKGRLYESAMDELKAKQEGKECSVDDAEGGMKLAVVRNCANRADTVIASREGPKLVARRVDEVVRSSFHPSASGDASNEAPANEAPTNKVLGKRKGRAEELFGPQSMLAKVLRLRCHATACKDRTRVFSCSFGFDHNTLDGQQRLRSPTPPRGGVVPRYSCTRASAITNGHPASPAGEGPSTSRAATRREMR
jgi:hypothetical protein